MWETDSKLSLQVKYYVIQMGVTVFEEADLVFCCSTSQKMKRKTYPPTTGIAFASFPDHVSDILWCLLRCVLLPFMKRGGRLRKYQVHDSPTSSWKMLSKWSTGTDHKECHHLGQSLADQTQDQYSVGKSMAQIFCSPLLRLQAKHNICLLRVCSD